MAIIEINKLRKAFSDIIAVDNINLTVDEGECLGLLGPNGAGKTTLVRMITAVSPPDSGDIKVLGKELQRNERRMKGMFGVVPQIDNLDHELTVLQNLATFARYFNLNRKEARHRSMEVLKLFKLDERCNDKIKALSGGMRRRLLMARGLINNPKIMVLDEPTTGLDPQAKYLVWQKLKELKGWGITQLLSTQNMDEAAVLCDRVAIMHQGRILALDSPRNLINKYVGRMIVEIEVRPEQRENILAEVKKRRVKYVDTVTTIQIMNSTSDSLMKELQKSNWNTWQRLATLEDVFLELTGRALIE